MQSHHFMTNRWGNDRNNKRLFLGLQITADGDCSHEIKRRLLLERKAVTILSSMLNSILKKNKTKDIILPTNVHLVKAVAFPAVIYGCESWTINKAKHWKTFEPWYWRRLLRVPWTSRRSNQSILREISPEYSLERLMLKLKLQYVGHLIRRTNSLKKTLILGKIECRRGWQRMDGWIASLTCWAWV